MTRAAGPSLDPVRCPLCAVAPGPDGVCPDCGEDLTPLSHLQARPVLHYNRALALAAAGDDDRAVRAVSAALTEDERFVDAWVVLGKLEARRGHREDARRAWRSALDVEPGHAGAQAALDALGAAPPVPEPEPSRRRRRVLPLVLAALLVLGLLVAGVALLLPRGPVAPPPLAAPPAPVVAPAPGGGTDARLLGDAVAAVQGVAPITFPGAAGAPTPAGAATARTLAGLLAGQRTPVVVEGYAARTAGGSTDGARQLSEARAASVRDILVAGGVDPATITVRGLGDADPQPTVAASRRAVVRLGGP